MKVYMVLKCVLFSLSGRFPSSLPAVGSNESILKSALICSLGGTVSSALRLGEGCFWFSSGCFWVDKCTLSKGLSDDCTQCWK